MKRILLAVGFMCVAPVANAGLFCDDNTWDFARWRTDAALSDVEVDAQTVIMGRQNSGWGMVCDSATNTCTTLKQDTPQLDPPEMVKKYTAAAKKYEAKVLALEEWAGALDWCAKRAYQDRVAYHRKQVERAYKAIEFLKTPAPFEPNS